MLDEVRLRELAGELCRVPGVVAVMLGGSRARGDQLPDSDVDLGLYYRPPLDIEALRALARERAGPDATATPPGAWGPWVDGGAWLSLAGTAVDWIYRDLDRVQGSWADASQGRLEFHFQVGHPFGVPNVEYAGEVALGVALADPSGELSRLHREAATYPDVLGDAFVSRLDEARFLLGALVKPAARGDTAYVAGSLFRVVGLCAYALHGWARRWMINEKGAVAAAGRLPGVPTGFSGRAHGVLAGLGTNPADLARAVAAADHLLADTAATCRTARPG